MNRYAHLKGHTVTLASLPTTRRLAADFPGWGAENYADFLLPFTAANLGMTGRIDTVESHGMAPYTRFCVTWSDGTRSIGLDPTHVRVGA